MDRGEYSDNDFFRMGAIVATGELYDMGDLGDKQKVAGKVRGFLETFGIRSMEDLQRLGVKGPYIHDFEGLYGEAV